MAVMSKVILVIFHSWEHYFPACMPFWSRGIVFYCKHGHFGHFTANMDILVMRNFILLQTWTFWSSYCKHGHFGHFTANMDILVIRKLNFTANNEHFGHEEFLFYCKQEHFGHGESLFCCKTWTFWSFYCKNVRFGHEEFYSAALSGLKLQHFLNYSCSTFWIILCSTFWVIICCTFWVIICSTFWIIVAALSGL